jgi:hypothetical protein
MFKPRLINVITRLSNLNATEISVLSFRPHRLHTVQLSGRRLGILCLTTLLGRPKAAVAGATVLAGALYSA